MYTDKCTLCKFVFMTINEIKYSHPPIGKTEHATARNYTVLNHKNTYGNNTGSFYGYNISM